MILVDFLLTPEMQMLPKYHQLSCVDMEKKKKKKRNDPFFCLFFCITKEWYTDICQVLLMRLFVLCVNCRIFPFCYGLLSVYFGMMYDDCRSVTSDLTSQIQFWLTNGWLLVEISQHQKMYESIYKVAWSWTSGQSLKEACCFSWITMTCWFWFENYTV